MVRVPATPPPLTRARAASLTLMEKIVLLGLKDEQGYLSFLNDAISYVLRGCILMELSLRGRIRTVRHAAHYRPPMDRHLEVANATPTGDILLDEALRLIKTERHSITTWLDLLSGETWNPMKSGFQLKQVRERTAKGLVDKGILRTEKRTFLIFEMATHPVSCVAPKAALRTLLVNILCGKGDAPALPGIVLACAALSANVLDPVLSQLASAQRELARSKASALLRQYASEEASGNDIVAGILSIFSRMDSLLY